MASEPPPPTYWGMLLGPGFDPSWLDWSGNPFEGIFNPLIAPGFDPNQFCQQPEREYRADNLDYYDPLPPDGRKVGVGSYLGSRNYQSQYSDGINYDWCMATCLLPKLLALLPHVGLQALINAVPLLGTVLHSPIDPDAPLLEPGPSPVPNPGRKAKRVLRIFRNGAWRFVLRDADDYSYIWNPHWAELGQWGYKSYAPYYGETVHGSVTTTMLGYRAAQLTRILNGAMRAAPIIGHLHLRWQTLKAIEDAYDECAKKCGAARAM